MTKLIQLIIVEHLRILLYMGVESVVVKWWFDKWRFSVGTFSV